MKSNIPYKNFLICGESFQREKNGTWIPQYTLTRRNTGNSGNHFPSQQYQLNEAFATEDEADKFCPAKSEGVDRRKLKIK
jgi:hypothetical protein